MPRIINTEGIPENHVVAFMQRIVAYEREIGAKLDEGHVALARFMFLARIDTMTTNVTIQALTEADIKKWVEESILETLAAGPGPGTITRDNTEPVDMVLFCPSCGVQHIDAPELPQRDFVCTMDPNGMLVPLPSVPRTSPPWTNPPHRSHLCGSCGHIWRPADVPTNGVQSIATRGQNDSLPAVGKSVVKYCAGMYRAVARIILSETGGFKMEWVDRGVRPADGTVLCADVADLQPTRWPQ